MYMACRHILPNGLRCKSPALREGLFCYFHSKLHTSARRSTVDDLRLPVIEDPAALQLALTEVLNSLLSTRIDPRRAGQLLYGLQIAATTLQRSRHADVQSVQSLTQSEQGDEIAPELRICDGNENCSKCPYAATCPNRRDDDEDEDEDDEDEDYEEEIEEEEEEEEGGGSASLEDYKKILRRIESLHILPETEQN